MKTALSKLAFLLCVFSFSIAPARQSVSTHAPASGPAGAHLYKTHCAVCHGNDLKGNGPAPAPFREETPDLTTLSKRHGGFPEAYVSIVLKNGAKIEAHGPAEMPFWGTTFRDADGLNEAQLNQRIAALIGYLKSRQVK